MAGAQKSNNGMWIFGLIVAGVLLVIYFKNTTDPLQGQTPAFLSSLDEQRTLCENRVGELKAKGIDGRREYEQAQVAANGCIAFLVAALDSPQFDSNELQNRVGSMETASRTFVAWANGKLAVGGGAGANNVDPMAIIKQALEMLNKQEQDRRDAVKKSLNAAKFKGWDEIGSGKPTGDLPR